MAENLRGIRRVAAFAAACALATGCDFLIEPKPDVDHPQVLEVDGLQISYPGNWKATREATRVDDHEMVTVTFESTGNATAFVQHFKPAVPFDAGDMADEYVKGIVTGAGEELGGLASASATGSEDISRSILGERRDGKRERFQIELLGERVPHTLDLYPASLQDRTVVFVSSVADEDQAKSQPAFDLLMDSAKLP